LIPPAGFVSEVFPLRHRVIYSYGLPIGTGTTNSACATLVRHTNDIIITGAGVPKMIVVNPRNTAFVEDNGPAVCNMSIIDKLSLSLRFNMTEQCEPTHETAAGVFSGDGISAIKCMWRPIFFSFGEKLDAADDDTGTTVAAILNLTKDVTFEDIVPITVTKLPVTGPSDKSQPVSTVNIAEVFGDYNMTTNTTMEGFDWDEDLFQTASRRYTNKGALKACVGRTRHFTLTNARPYMNFFIKKFVPRAIRRVQPYTFMAILTHIATDVAVEQAYMATDASATIPHVGVKIICNYHEWNQGHYQDPEGLPPTSA